MMFRSFFIMFIMIMAAPGTILAEEAAPCSVDMVPIQIMKIINDSPVTTLSEADFNYSHRALRYFYFFVKDVTEHLSSKLEQEKLCLNSAESRERSLIQFIPWSLSTGSLSLSMLPEPKTRSASSVCRISSPWLEIVIERDPVPSVRGLVRYNERQLLADQASLAGVHDVPPGVAMPVTSDDFHRYAEYYWRSEVLHQPADKPIEERIPPDLLWLFRHTDHEDPWGGIFPAEALSTTKRAMIVGVEGYTKVVTTLIDRCFETDDGGDFNYGNILDLDDPALFEQYKITTSITPDKEQ